MATISSAVATGRTINGRDGFIRRLGASRLVSTRRGCSYQRPLLRRSAACASLGTGCASFTAALAAFPAGFAPLIVARLLCVARWPPAASAWSGRGLHFASRQFHL